MTKPVTCQCGSGNFMGFPVQNEELEAISECWGREKQFLQGKVPWKIISYQVDIPKHMYIPPNGLSTLYKCTQTHIHAYICVYVCIYIFKAKDKKLWGKVGQGEVRGDLRGENNVIP